MRKIYVPVFTATVVFLTLISIAVAAPVKIVGTLQNVDGDSLPGKITVIQEVPSLTFTSHEVDGSFEIEVDSKGELVLHAHAPKHSSKERVIPAGSTDVVFVDFELPPGQDVEVRVVDGDDNAVAGAELRVRYHEPDKPMRRVSFERDEVTDGDGRFLLRDVGIAVPFVVDVLAPNYPPASSELTNLSEGETEMEDIVLGKPGAMVVVMLVDKDNSPVPGASVMLLADPAGLAPEDRDSWLHHLAFRQRAVTSTLGNVRFSGVPPGRIIVRVKTHTSAIEHRGVAVSNEELRISLTVR